MQYLHDLKDKTNSETKQKEHTPKLNKEQTVKEVTKNVER